jgi:guanylate kinase
MATLSTTQGLLFMVVGPPGAGKNALMNDAMRHLDDLRQLATATTRKRRPDEQDGRERLFVTIEYFEHMIASGALLEWQEVHPDKFYGVPRQPLETAIASGTFLIADIDVLGATYIRSAYPDNGILIFIQPPSVEALEDRMQTRGETDADIHARLSRVAMEMDYLPLADYVVINDHFDQASAQFRQIITTEMQRQRASQPPPYRYHYTAGAIPLYGDEVLIQQATGQFPACSLLPREIPHEAALRALRETLNLDTEPSRILRLKPNRGSFLPPADLTVQADGATRHVTFTYIYLLDQRPVAPPGWHWQPRREIYLPDSVRSVLYEFNPNT